MDWPHILQVQDNNFDIPFQIISTPWVKSLTNIHLSKNLFLYINILCEIGQKSVKNFYHIASEFNKHLTSIAKQIKENLIKTKHKYSK